MKKIFLPGLCLLLFSLITKAQVGIGTSTPAASAQLDVSSVSKGFLPPRMTTTQRNAISSPASGLTIYNTSTKGFECFNGTNWYSTVHFIGESYGGGIVFYVYDNGQHGLIVSEANQSTSCTSFNGTFRATGSTGDGVNAGLMNTILQISMQLNDITGGNFAARYCADYEVTVGDVTYGDWYLPSYHELILLSDNKTAAGLGFSNLNYWSSTEAANTHTYAVQLDTGNSAPMVKDWTFAVRAIRAF